MASLPPPQNVPVPPSTEELIANPSVSTTDSYPVYPTYKKVWDERIDSVSPGGPYLVHTVQLVGSDAITDVRIKITNGTSLATDEHGFRDVAAVVVDDGSGIITFTSADGGDIMTIEYGKKVRIQKAEEEIVRPVGLYVNRGPNPNGRPYARNLTIGSYTSSP